MKDEEEDLEFSREVERLIREGRVGIETARLAMPHIPRAWCARCRREISWEEYGLTAYDGKCWHPECLKRWLAKQIELILGKVERTGSDYERLAEYQEAIGAMMR